MGNTSFKFLTAFFEMVLVYIVFANYFGWSGAYLNLGSYNSNGWSTDVYFGFSSIKMFLDDLGNVVNQSETWNFAGFQSELEELGNALTFGIVRVVDKLANAEFEPLDALFLFITFLIQPLLVLYHLLILGIYFVIYLIGFLGVAMRLLGGYYNVPFNDTPDIWTQWDYLSSEWNWSSLVVPIV